MNKSKDETKNERDKDSKKLYTQERQNARDKKKETGNKETKEQNERETQRDIYNK